MGRIQRRSILNYIAGGVGSTREMPTGTWTTRKHGSLKPDGITTIGVGVERYPIGTGWVAIPSNIKRQDYIETCMRVGKIGLFLESGDFLWDIPIDLWRLQQIEFPDKYGEFGSCVAFINIPKHNTPIVVAILSKDDEIQDYVEGILKLRKETNGAYAEIIIDGKTGSITTSVQNSSGSKPPRIVSLIGDRDYPAEISNTIFGKVLDYIEGNYTKRASDFIEWIVEDPSKDDKITKITYKKGEGYNFLDEFSNNIKTEDKKITIDSEEILHGANANEPAVLGDTLEDIMGDFLDAIVAMTVNTGVGVSTTPINIPQFEAVRSRLQEFKSKKNKIE